MPFPGYKIYEEYNPDQYKTSVQKKVEKVLGDAEKEKGRINPESLEFRGLIDREAESLNAFFGHDVEIPALPDEITPERYEKWKEMGFELHYLPSEEMKGEANFPGWKKKPRDRFYERLQAKEIPADAATLPAAWILTDTREKPQYDNGKQMYKEDVLAPVLEDLRKKKIIADFEVKGSRFRISWDELNKPEVKQAIAEAMDVPEEYLRPPRAIEWNFIGNAYHPEWGDTNTWEWFNDPYMKGRGRLVGGYSGLSGLSSVDWIDPGARYDGLGFRLQVVFPHS